MIDLDKKRMYRAINKAFENGMITVAKDVHEARCNWNKVQEVTNSYLQEEEDGKTN